jgi:phosphopantothenoylcysteine decarboxylase/phosphopantothenate--cysteine ligase
MDLDMWAHAASERNLSQLMTDGVHLIPVGHGELASGLTGDGRMAEPEEIVTFLKTHFEQSNTFAGKHVLVTAGPTHEAIDPVRFIGNPSTGKMGIAIAEAFAARGAQVSLILGPVVLRPSGNVQVIPVQSAQQMFEASVDLFPSVDIAVLAAAVSDYTPARTSATKIKKDAGPENLELVRTKDIAMELGNMKKNGQLVIGFALETNDAEVHAKEKLKKKNFDFIVLNTLEDQGSGFGHDTNVVKFIFPDNDSRSFGLKSKIDVAADICEAVAQLMRSHD